MPFLALLRGKKKRMSIYAIEANLMAGNPSVVYEIAHEIAQRKYNYAEALTEYLKNNNLD